MGAGAGPCFRASSMSIFLCHSERSEETRLPEARVEEDRAGRSLSRLDSTSLKRKPLESKDLREAISFFFLSVIRSAVDTGAELRRREPRLHENEDEDAALRAC
jgi:hypothetical protein